MQKSQKNIDKKAAKIAANLIAKHGKTAVVAELQKAIKSQKPRGKKADAPAPDAAKLALAELTRLNRTLTADATGVARGATNYGAYSNRDSSYIAFYGAVCRAEKSDRITLAVINEYAELRDGKLRNPFYSKSAKATDVGAINRQSSAGYFTKSADGSAITATDNAKTLAAYNAETITKRAV